MENLWNGVTAALEMLCEFLFCRNGLLLAGFVMIVYMVVCTMDS